MHLTALLSGIEPWVLEKNGEPADIAVSGIYHDSRMLHPGGVFVALRGETTDGHYFIADAATRGAQCILVEEMPERAPAQAIMLVRVQDTKRCFSRLSAAFFEYPSHKLPCIGITGTNGKSTLVHYLLQLLQAKGLDVHYLSTVGRFERGRFTENQHHLSTPDAFTVQQFIADAVGSADIVLLEATSHALSPRTYRLEDVRFAAAFVSNITHEHLDFHKSFANYTHDKLRLVNNLLDASSGAESFYSVPLNAHGANDKGPSKNRQNTRDRGNGFAPFLVLQSGEHFESAITANPAIHRCYIAPSPETKTPHEVHGTVDAQNTTQAKQNTATLASSTAYYTVSEEHFFSSLVDVRLLDETVGLKLPVSGLHNVKNLLMALLGAVRITGESLKSFAEVCSRLTNPIGRMQIVQERDPLVVVDFAHSPDAFSVFLRHARRHTRGKLIVVFGSAGERDKKKRAMQGTIAAAYADSIILCDEDPRKEASETILNDILQGVQRHQRWKAKELECVLIPDRRRALSHAVTVAGKYDTLCALGKGHETSILYGTHAMEWNEITELKKALEQKRL